jgi:hypothetical protein
LLLLLEPEFSFGRVDQVDMTVPEVPWERRASASPSGDGGWTLRVERGASVVDIEATLAGVRGHTRALGIEAGEHGGHMAINLFDGGEWDR